MSVQPGDARRAWTWATRAAYLAMGLLFVAFIYHAAPYFTIDRDQSQNIGIARSIADDFCYCSMSTPPIVFPTEESSNGPLEYVGAFFFAVTRDNEDVAREGTATVAAAVLMIALFVLEPWLVVVAFVLFFIWPTVQNLSEMFFGEMWAIALSILGFALLTKMDLAADPRALFRNGRFLAACACFGLAMESKLVAAPSIVLIVFALAYGRGAAPKPGSLLTKLGRAALVTAAATAGALVVLFVSIAFSVAHSTHLTHLHKMLQTPAEFIWDMIGQGTNKSDPDLLGHIGRRIADFPVPLVLFAPLLAAVVSALANWTYLPFIAVTFVTWMKIGDNPDHIAIAFYLLIVMGAFEAPKLVRGLAARLGIPVVSAEAVGLVAALALLWRLWPVSFPASIPSGPLPNQRYAFTGLGAYYYSAKLVDVIRRQRYVEINGFWGFPDISVRENFHFYNRFEPESRVLPKDQVALLFDDSFVQHPGVSKQDDCLDIIYEEGPIVLCHPR